MDDPTLIERLKTAMPDAHGWQPISTAPRDKWIWGINNPTALESRHFVMRSSPAPDNGQYWAPNAGWYAMGHVWPAYPTHWQPKPPEAGDG